ncbi:MacS family sensor histidine kinase [Streptomyces sp. NPDC059853]|uniref:MacS family sensor histidine kinase n=1 Tax=Streptomyces sp. NPDC059853 TaxID=3346973 RepID=UPI0036586BE6
MGAVRAPERRAGPGQVISVEQPLWRALTGYRVVTLGYAVALFALGYGDYGRPLIGVGYLALLTVWTLLTLRRVTSADRCTARFLALDLTMAVGGILLSSLADPANRVGPTLPSIWVAGAVIAVAIKSGWRWAAFASALVGVANLVEDGHFSRSALHNVLLVCVASIAIGYVVEVARASERTLARALRIEAANRERERLARDIHDSVLQVLAMVQRRGTAIGGEAAELGRLAGEQEVALRALVTGRPPDGAGPPPPPEAGDAPAERGSGSAEGADAADDPDELDLGVLLTLAAGGPGREADGGPRGPVTYAGPGCPVPLPAATARTVAAAVGAALDNVRRHATGPSGEPAAAWILLEDEPEEITVTVRDDGPGIPEGRLAAAEAEGRMGAALSIRGRMTELGGSARWISVPGQGTEVELRLPRQRKGARR